MKYSARTFIKAFITSYSNEVLVQKLIHLYPISEEKAQELIQLEGLAYQSQFKSESFLPNNRIDIAIPNNISI